MQILEQLQKVNRWLDDVDDRMATVQQECKDKQEGSSRNKKLSSTSHRKFKKFLIISLIASHQMRTG